ncbi:MAG: S1C family serine protease [Spirulinaceae cyanobacterium]
MNIRYLWAISLGLFSPFSPVFLLAATASEPPALPPLIALSEEEQARIALYEKAIPAVVALEVPATEQRTNFGSGSIINETGLILTNAHIFENALSNQVVVKTAWPQDYDARLIARDTERDLALVQISYRQFPTLPLSLNSSLQVGQTVYAIGTPVLVSPNREQAHPLPGTLTVGVLSAIRSDIADRNDSVWLVVAPDGLQIDAPINPGNSGGPLLNSYGELIGVNTSVGKTILGEGLDVEMSNGIAFAVSIGEVTAFLDENQDKIRQAAHFARQPDPVTSLGLAQLGVEINNELLIHTVSYGSAADRAGLKPLDRIIAVNGRRMRLHRLFKNFLATMQNEPAEAEFTIERDGERQEILVDFTQS